MSYKKLNISAAAAPAIVGENKLMRVRITNEVLQIRPTHRTSLVNLPDTEAVLNISAKGNGRSVGLRSEFTASLNKGMKIALVPAKYGWFSVVDAEQASAAAGETVAVAGSITE